MHVWTDGYGYGAIFPTSEDEIKEIHDSHKFLSTFSGEKDMLGRENYATFWGEKTYAPGMKKSMTAQTQRERSTLKKELPRVRASTNSSRRRQQTGRSNRTINASPIASGRPGNNGNDDNMFYHTKFMDEGMDRSLGSNSPLRSTIGSSASHRYMSSTSSRRAQTSHEMRRSRMFQQNSPSIGGFLEGRESPGPQSWKGSGRRGVAGDFNATFGIDSRSPSPERRLPSTRSTPALSGDRDLFAQRPTTSASEVDWGKFNTFTKKFEIRFDDNHYERQRPTARPVEQNASS